MLSAGDKLGPCEIVEPIAKGGMAEGFRARDPRLVREVAIKVFHADGQYRTVGRLVWSE